MLVVTKSALVAAQDASGPRLPQGTIVYVSDRNGEWLLVPRWNKWLHASHVRSLPDAVTEFSERLQSKPTGELYYLRGIARLELGQLAEAREDFDAAVRAGLGSSHVFLNRGLVWGRSGNADQALADFSEAIRRDRKNALAYFNRGVLHAHANQEAAALKDFDAAIKLEPEYAEAFNNRGVVHQQRGDLDRALADFNAALQHRPRYPSALTNRAYIHQERGDYTAALADYAAALQINPDAAATLNDLAWLLATCPDDLIRNGEAALQAAERACELTGRKSSDYLDTLAAAAAEAGQFDRAVETAQEALRIAPPEDRADLESRLALYREGQPYREPSREPLPRLPPSRRDPPPDAAEGSP